MMFHLAEDKTEAYIFKYLPKFHSWEMVEQRLDPRQADLSACESCYS